METTPTVPNGAIRKFIYTVVAVVALSGFIVLGCWLSPSSSGLIVATLGGIVTAMLLNAKSQSDDHAETKKDIEVVRQDVDGRMKELIQVYTDLSKAREEAAEWRGKLQAQAQAKEDAATKVIVHAQEAQVITELTERAAKAEGKTEGAAEEAAKKPEFSVEHAENIKIVEKAGPKPGG